MHFTSTTSGQSMDMHITLPNDQNCLKANTTMKMIYETRKLCCLFLSMDLPCCRALSKCHRVAQSYYFVDNFSKGNNDSNAAVSEH